MNDGLELRHAFEGRAFAEAIAAHFGWTVSGFGYPGERIIFARLDSKGNVVNHVCERDVVAALTDHVRAEGGTL